MRAFRRFRLPARIALAAMLAAIALAGASVGTSAADNPVTLVVHVGYQDAVKLGERIAVTIDAKNAGGGVDGTLEVQEVLSGQPGVGGLPIYQAPISLASGASKRIRTYVTLDTTGASVTARIIQSGRVIVSQGWAGPTGGTPSTLIGVLSDQATSLDGFAAVHPASVNARVVHLRADEIAESALPLRAFDILAIDDFATDSLTAGQRTAISDFVRAGGDLLLGTGAAWRKTLAGLPPAIVPMTISGTTSVTTDLLGGSAVEVATGVSTPGPAWLATGSQPVLIERRVGAGIVTLAAFDWNQEPVAGWSGTAPLLRQLIARSVFGAGGSSQNFMYGIGGPSPMNFSSQPTLASKSGALSSTLGNLPGLDLPSLQLTGGLGLLCVLLVGPVNSVVWGAMRRRALAWVSVPLIAVIAAGGAYGAGILTKGRSVQANQVTILHVQPGWDHAYQETYTGIMAPSGGDYQAAISGGGAPDQYDRQQRRLRSIGVRNGVSLGQPPDQCRQQQRHAARDDGLCARWLRNGVSDLRSPAGRASPTAERESQRHDREPLESGVYGCRPDHGRQLSDVWRAETRGHGDGQPGGKGSHPIRHADLHPHLRRSLLQWPAAAAADRRPARRLCEDADSVRIAHRRKLQGH